jgi:hypothetical protein
MHTKPHPISCGISDPWAHSSAPPGPCSPKLDHWAPKASQAGNPQTFTISSRPCPSGLHRPAWSPQGCTPHTCTCLHNLCQDHALKAYQASNPQTCDLHSSRPAPFRHARPTLQRIANSPQQKASTYRPMGPPPTCHPPQEGYKPA